MRSRPHGGPGVGRGAAPSRPSPRSPAARAAGLAVGVGFVLILASLASLARDVLLLVFIAVLLGAALEPVVAAIRGRTGIGRGLRQLLSADFVDPVLLPVCTPAAGRGEALDGR